MRITILAYGSRGDVQPYVALGAGLGRAGHTVRLAAPEMFRTLVSGHGLEFAPLAGDPRILTERVIHKVGGQPDLFRAVPVLLSYVVPLAAQVLADAEHACAGADAIIHSLLMTTAGHEIALRMGVPDLSAMLFAVFAPTGAFPNAGFPALPLGSRYNRATHALFDRIFWHAGRLAYHGIVRRKHPELPRLTEWPFGAASRRPAPILYGFSPHLVPRPTDWGADVHVTGFWQLDPPAQWSPPAELAAFLDAGPPPVCISFGSVIDRDAGRLTAIVLGALARSGQRGLLVAGWGGLAAADLSRDVFMVDYAPFEWLFPRVAATVVHGGIGTVAASLRAGRPTVVVPFAGDQNFWGERVWRAGAGTRPIPRRRLTAERLAQAIQAALGDAEIGRRAGELGRDLRAENGVENAVEIIERYLGERQTSLPDFGSLGDFRSLTDVLPMRGA